MRNALLTLLASLLVLWLAGCSTVHKIAAKYPAPNIERLYAAPREYAGRNPLVLLPGLAGSTISDTEGQVVWGAIHKRGTLSYGRASGLRALTLPNFRPFASLTTEQAMAELYHLRDDSVATEIMAYFHTAVIFDVEFPVYAGLLKGLARAGYRLEPAGLAEALDAPMNPDGTPCFVFAYDWRLDIAGLAAQLESFLDQSESWVREDRARRGAPEKAEPPVRFDILAHSMGSLIARYYLRFGGRDVVMEDAPEVTWAGSDRIERLAMLSPPNRGSIQALRDAIFGDNVPFMPPFQPAMVTSWISVPQMFPRPEMGWLKDEEGRPADLDIFDVSVWRDNQWGPYRKDQQKTLVRLFPGVPDEKERLRRFGARFEASLLRGQRFVRLMDRPPSTRPPRTTLHLFASDSERTLAGGKLVQGENLLKLEFGGVDQPGDSSITRSSALSDLRPQGSSERLRSAVPWDSVMFLADTHGGLLSNKVFHDNLLYLLLESSAPSPLERSTGPN